MLDWLKADLEKTGRDKPVIIGFHHWIGRESVQIDNEQALLDLVAPYNVRLWLNGHGHADIQWSVNGVPALMAKGLYQGSYHLIEVTADKLRVLRRRAEATTPTEVMTVSLARPAAMQWSADARLRDGKIEVSAERGNLPPDARLIFRLNQGKPNPMTASETGWRGELASEGVVAGEQVIKVEAALPDGRAYQRFARLTLHQPGTPTPLWTKNLGGAIQSRLMQSGDTLFVTSMGGDLVALHAATGAEKWRLKTAGAVFSTPHVENGTVYFGSADHFAYAVDAATGTLKWKNKTGGAVFAGAALAQGIVCIASVDTKIYGLKATTGEIVWTAQGGGMYQSKAATDGALFFVGGWDNYFRALDVQTGREVWKNKFGKSFYYSPAIGSPAVGEGKVFVTSNDGFLHAMDAKTGKVLWEVNGPSLGYSGPLYRDGRIYNGSLTGNGRVFCFHAANGEKLWEAPTGSVIYDSSSAWGGGNIHIGSVNGVFSALRAEDGAQQWQTRLAPGHLLASPTADEQRVYIGSMNGDVTAFPLFAATPR
jgi:outer membrane protein assembly factor BamB